MVSALHRVSTNFYKLQVATLASMQVIERRNANFEENVEVFAAQGDAAWGPPIQNVYDQSNFGWADVVSTSA
jgi:hypothetical protein